MTHPNLKALALAAVEARKNYDKTDHSLNNEFFEWQKVKELFSIYATPERILEYRDEVLEEIIGAIKSQFPPSAASGAADGVSFDGQMYPSQEIIGLIKSLKSKEPSP